MLEALAIRKLTAQAIEAIAPLVLTLTDDNDRVRAAGSIAALTKAWQMAYNTGRIIRGQPLPGSLRPERKEKRKPQRTMAPTEAPTEQPAPMQLQNISEPSKESLSPAPPQATAGGERESTGGP